MTFHSLDFLIFFVIVFAVYWSLRHRSQNIFLLAVSCFFYGYIHPWFLALMFTSVTIDYFAALAMGRFPARKKMFLLLSIAGNLGILGFFKYFGFFVENVEAILKTIGLPPTGVYIDIFLPVGISFYTFQALSYTIDVYRGDLAPRKSFVDYALFVSFFPQLVAGPIEEASHLLPQVERERRFSWENVRSGLSLVLWGFFKKLVVADTVGVIANKIFALQNPGFELLWTGVFAFCIQIYADFSAYSDIARGSARMLDFEIMKNFNHPYFSRDPVDLWRRWHISLSNWFRKYVYIPLGGSQNGFNFQIRNIMITFFLSGLWHGASWNYVIWGLYNGALVSLFYIKNRYHRVASRSGLGDTLRIAGMFVLINIGWLMFRETDIHQLIRHLTLFPGSSSDLYRSTAAYLFVMVAIYSIPIWLEPLYNTFRTRVLVNHNLRFSFETTGAMVLFLFILILGSRRSLDFIYFQF